ncbi:glycosyl transferase family (plasmid) [Aureimonas sp. AU20]|nr:glycosyl transferase family [Aureimonas sp. AU20]
MFDTILSAEHLDDLQAENLLPLAPSGWHELVPVAHWLMGATRPRVLVELGSHAGVSFSAFCNAMMRKGIVGKAYAVDTWQGDEHAGRYSETIYDDLRAFVDERYKDFAHLLRMTFDEALGEFEDGSVDFLHIDGFHTYEAVKHDFESWRSKLSDRGVVILHDVNVRHPGFGVWRYWEELLRTFPSFEFPHGNGLGVVAVGENAPQPILALTNLQDPDAILKLRSAFSKAGRPHGRLYEAHARHSFEQSQQRERLSLLQTDRDLIDEDRLRLDREKNDLGDQVSDLRGKFSRADAELKNTRRLYDRLRTDQKTTETELFETKRTLHDVTKRLEAATTLNSMVVASKSWKLTHPLRAVNARLAPQKPRIDLLRKVARPSEAEARRILFRAIKRRIGLSVLHSGEDAAGIYAPNLTEQDKTVLAALSKKSEIPSVSALIIVENSSHLKLEQSVAAIDAQVIPVKQILVCAPLDSPMRQEIEALARKRADIQPVWRNEVASITSVDSFLVLSSSIILRPEATAVMASEMGNERVELVYSDEIYVGKNGRADEPFFKPSYSPRLAQSSNYMGACALIRTRVGDNVETVTNILTAMNGSPKIEAGITAYASSLNAEAVRRTPFVLFTERNPERKLLEAAAKSPVGDRGEKVSIIIPTRDRLSLVAPCVDSIIEKTNYSRENYDIIIVDNGSVEEETINYLKDGASLGKFLVISDNSYFNYARLNNVAAKASAADVLVFLNNDTLIIQPDWLSRMVTAAVADGIGLVGAKLLYEDGSVQHGGVVLGIQGVAGHADLNIEPADFGYHGLAQHDREVSAVTGACIATRRDRFWEVGGFDENLAVAFNDTLLCINMLKAGYTNYQLNSVLVTHLESKSRGLDVTDEQKERFLLECRYARSRGQDYFLDDRYYSPNLSLQDTYKPAAVLRRRKPWNSPRHRKMPRVLILSCTHQRGHGVPVVIEQHAAYMRSQGIEVHIGGYSSPNDIAYEGCTRVELNDPFTAIAYATTNDIDIVIPHTPPFFSVARWAGPFPFVAAYDHGEPPPHMFPDAEGRREINKEKTFALSLMRRLYGNSEPVRDESGFPEMVVVPLGNSHMDRWEPSKENIRNQIRSKYGWGDKVVILNVCRFHEAERSYKGVDFFIALRGYINRNIKEIQDKVVFVQCGKASLDDIYYVSSEGVECFANVTDQEMSELYYASDIYANFSQWEGWNLGIAQALAYGLPVVASNIDAHRRNFDVKLADDLPSAADEIVALVHDIEKSGFSPEREAHVDKWETRLKPFLDDLLQNWRKL